MTGPTDDQSQRRRNRRDSLIGIRNCLEFLLQETNELGLRLPSWLLRMAIASMDEELRGMDARPGLTVITGPDKGVQEGP